MTYIITDNTVSASINGKMYMCDISYEYFDQIVKALKEGAPEDKIINLFRKKFTATAKRLLKK